jgi:hypothetical protein
MLLKKIDSYHKKQLKKLKKMNMDKNYIIKFDKKRQNIINFYNTQEKVYSAEYIFYGALTEDLVFNWNNTIYGFKNKKMLDRVKEIKSQYKLFENDNSKRSIFYHNLLKSNKIKLTSDDQLLWLNKLLLYVNRDFYYITPINSNNYMQIIGINKIKEKYILN